MPAGEGLVARVRCSDRSDGDFGGGAGALLEARRQEFMAGPWTWLDQRHGAGVVIVAEPGQGAGQAGDAAVTNCSGAVLAVRVADCAPIVLVAGGVTAVAHVGWRGIVAGVISATVRAAEGLSTAAGAATVAPLRCGDLRALIGPVIRPGNYEFGAKELAMVTGIVGHGPAAGSDWGTPALDLAAAACEALAAAGVNDVEDLGFDTADERFYSSRVRGDSGRQVTAVRLEAVS